MTPLEAAAEAMAAVSGGVFANQHPRDQEWYLIRARAALTAAVNAIPEKRLDALRFAVTPEEVRGVLLRALVGETSVSGNEE